MANINQSEICCGVYEIYISGSSPKEVLRVVLYVRKVEKSIPPFYLFADIDDKRFIKHYGRDLAGYVKEHNLGTLVRTVARKNPNSGNYIRVWLWSVNNKSLSNYAKTHD